MSWLLLLRLDCPPNRPSPTAGRYRVQRCLVSAGDHGDESIQSDPLQPAPKHGPRQMLRVAAAGRAAVPARCSHHPQRHQTVQHLGRS